MDDSGCTTAWGRAAVRRSVGMPGQENEAVRAGGGELDGGCGLLAQFFVSSCVQDGFTPVACGTAPTRRSQIARSRTLPAVELDAVLASGNGLDAFTATDGSSDRRRLA